MTRYGELRVNADSAELTQLIEDADHNPTEVETVTLVPILVDRVMVGWKRADRP